MPAFGIILMLVGFWVLLRTVRHNLNLVGSNGKPFKGGLAEKILGE